MATAAAAATTRIFASFSAFTSPTAERRRRRSNPPDNLVRDPTTIEIIYMTPSESIWVIESL